MRGSPASFLAVLAVAALATAGRAQSVDYTLDNGHTSVIFGIAHMSIGYTYGRFNTAAGQITYDPTNPAQSRFAITVEATSLDTNNAERDAHLRQADFFDVQQFPQILFESSAIEIVEGKLRTTGTLTLHGVSRPLTVDLVKVGEGQDPQGNSRIGFLTQFSIRRSEFEMKNMLGPVGDEVSLTISFEGVRPPTP